MMIVTMDGSNRLVQQLRPNRRVRFYGLLLVLLTNFSQSFVWTIRLPRQHYYDCRTFTTKLSVTTDTSSSSSSSSSNTLTAVNETSVAITTLSPTAASNQGNNQTTLNNNNTTSRTVTTETSKGNDNGLDMDHLQEPYLSPMDSQSTFIDYTNDGLVVPAGPIGKAKEQTARFLSLARVEVAVAGMVLLNSLLVALATLPDLPTEMKTFLRSSEELVGVALVLEFAARWFSSSRENGKHVLDPQFVVDIFAIILPVAFSLTPPSFWTITPVPDWLTTPSGLFNLQLLRVFRLQRVLQNLDTFTRFEKALGVRLNTDQVKEWQLQLARVLLTLFTLLSVSTGLIYTAEYGVNPQITDYFTALYFGLTTLTTVGFGDIIPVTFGGKLVVGTSIIVGIAVVPAQAAALVEALLARQESRKPRKQVPKDMAAMNSFSSKVLDTAMLCENCGATLHWSDARYCYYCGEDL